MSNALFLVCFCFSASCGMPSVKPAWVRAEVILVGYTVSPFHRMPASWCRHQMMKL